MIKNNYANLGITITILIYTIGMSVFLFRLCCYHLFVITQNISTYEHIKETYKNKIEFFFITKNTSKCSLLYKTLCRKNRNGFFQPSGLYEINYSLLSQTNLGIQNDHIPLKDQCDSCRHLSNNNLNNNFNHNSNYVGIYKGNSSEVQVSIRLSRASEDDSAFSEIKVNGTIITDNDTNYKGSKSFTLSQDYDKNNLMNMNMLNCHSYQERPFSDRNYYY